jgi:2-(1,2-epoxy-1,2-dihydrophenyl)acetyl-CoA isomerase
MDYDDIAIEKQNSGVALLTLNRPEQLNALRWHSWDEIEDALGRLAEDDEVKVLVVTGKGRGFCAGADLASPEPPSDPKAVSRAKRLSVRYGGAAKLLAWPKPAIAAVNGIAAGYGLSLCLACDIRFASAAARFSAIWSRRALIADYGATYLLPRVTGISKALELMYTGDIIDAQEALRIGLVTRVVETEDLIPQTLALAERLARGSVLALELIKRLTYRQWRPDLDDQVALEEFYQRTYCLVSEDYEEAKEAFLNKREPQFKGY